MTKRKCYQCDDDETGETLANIQARRRAEIRAWADEQIALADAELKAAEAESLTGVPQFEGPLGSEPDQEIPQEQEVPSEEEAQAALNEKNDTSKNDADLSVDATAMGAEEQGDPVKVEDAKSEEKPVAKKASHAKKAADKDD